MRKFVSMMMLLWSMTSIAQIHNPVQWKTSVKQINAKEYMLIAEATIQSGWHLYSQNVKDGGPIPTTFTFHGDTDYTLKGNTKEPKGRTVLDGVFNMEITYFEGRPAFKQKVVLKNKKKVTINATVEYMVCNDTNCLPPTEEDLVFTINPTVKKKK